jgi:TIR domain
MAERAFPKPVEEVFGTLLDIYRHQGQSDILELLESANARIEQTGYDNWNGGTYVYSLMLDVPIPVFAALEPKLVDIEKNISSKLAIICRDLGEDTKDWLNTTVIVPLTTKLTSVGPRAKPAEVEVKHIWKEGFFRLFLSHVSAHKTAVSKLKLELQQRGISAFVAHEDITPSLDWQNEIELALRSMHALAALLTLDFHPSSWTDQEVGFALGKGVLVVPVRLGSNPYGFIGKVQGLSGTLEQPARLAISLSNTLLGHPSTHRHMRKGLVSAFTDADSYVNAISLSKVIATVKDFAEDEKALIQRACKENDQVFNPTGVVSRVCSAIGVPEPNKVPEADDVPF